MKSKINMTVLYSFMAIILFFSMVLAIYIGAVSISPVTITKIILHNLSGKHLFVKDWLDASQNIVWELRFPKLLVVAAVGANLALAGTFMQALTRNSLADPYILGISSGATTGAVLVLLFGGASIFGALSVGTGAFVGSMAAIFLVFAISKGNVGRDITKLVLVGVAVTAILSAMTNFIIFIAPDARKIAGAMFWMMGSFGGVLWKDVLPALFAITIGLVAGMAFNREMDALLIGEKQAESYGINVSLTKNVLIYTAAMMTAISVSISGTIGFVGLIIPHVSRSLVGAVHRRMIPFAALSGAIFLVWADMASRLVAIPREMPIGIITALLGGPFFLYLIKKESYSFSRK